MSKEEFYSGTRIELTEAEVKHFHFGRNDVATFVEHVEPTIRLYARNGFRKPAVVSRLLNKENKRTACGEAWTPRLAWFLLSFCSIQTSSRSLGWPRNRRRSRQRKPAFYDRLPSNQKCSVAANKSSDDLLTADEIASRLSSLGSWPNRALGLAGASLAQSTDSAVTNIIRPCDVS
jgi:hypothetical protein